MEEHQGNNYLRYLEMYGRMILRLVMNYKTDTISVTKHHTLQEHSLLDIALQGTKVDFFT
jgi:hypothetical protein